jgi:hypothetical protein
MRERPPSALPEEAGREVHRSCLLSDVGRGLGGAEVATKFSGDSLECELVPIHELSTLSREQRFDLLPAVG